LAFSALTLLVGWQEGHLACKKPLFMLLAGITINGENVHRGYLSGARCK